MESVSSIPKAIDILGADAPDVLLAIAQNNLDKVASGEMKQHAATEKTLVEINAAGYYKLSSGWHQIREDVRGKISIEPAIRQPDGTYVVENVQIFYPNAVKRAKKKDGTEGDLVVFTADKIQRIIATTNAYIASGGHEPSILVGHPGSNETYAAGRSVKFRIIDGRPYCTITHLAAEAARQWAAKGLMSVSAAFTSDVDDLNCRIAHVAILGSSSPALSHLKRTDIFMDYQAEVQSESKDYVLAYSAEEPVIFRSPTMSKETERAEKRRKCFSALDAAYAAKEAGEPGHEKKVAEAYAAMKAEFSDDDEFCKAFAAEEPKDEKGKKGKKAKGDEFATVTQRPQNDPCDLNFSNPMTTREGGWASGAIELVEEQGGDLETNAPRVRKTASGGLDGSYVPKSSTSFATRAEVAEVRAELAVRDFKDYMNDQKSAGHEFNSETMLGIVTGASALIPGIELAKKLISESPLKGTGYASDATAKPVAGLTAEQQAAQLKATMFAADSQPVKVTPDNKAVKGLTTPGTMQDVNGAIMTFKGPGHEKEDLQELEIGRGMKFGAETLEKAASIYEALDAINVA